MQKNILAYVCAAAVILLLIPATSNVTAQSAIAWTEYQDGMQLARSHNKPVMIFFESWPCPWCEKQKEVFADHRVINLSTNFVPISGSKGLEGKYGIRATPSIVFTNPQGEELFRLVGYQDTETLLGEMQYALKLASEPMRTPFHDPYADTKTPGFEMILALTAFFICWVWYYKQG
ncbi:MAG: thioredoxin family protein [Candidatus Methanospirareceae archaeon]